MKLSCLLLLWMLIRSGDTKGNGLANKLKNAMSQDNAVFISHQEASQFIKHRSKRANSWLRTEEFDEGNIERECREEACSREEAREAFEDETLFEEFWRVYSDPDQCNPNPCVSENTLRCENTGGEYNCICRPGYEARNCDVETDVCDSQPCENDGSCQRHSRTSFSCICSPGFRGSICNVNINDCLNNNCGIFGRCVDGINNYTCSCIDGFTGSTCDVNIDDCASQPCLNGGTCTDGVNQHFCECTAGFEGRNCEYPIDLCAARNNISCLNGGICSATSSSIQCNCSFGFVGTRCEIVGNVCDVIKPCLNGGNCTVVIDPDFFATLLGGIEPYDGYEYLSGSGIAESEDNATIITRNSTHLISMGYTCQCPPEYRGEDCSERTPICELTPEICASGMTCVSTNLSSDDDDYLCVCPADYHGDRCQFRGEDVALQRFSCPDTTSNPCLNEGRCLIFGNETTCLCRRRNSGSYCESFIDPCGSSDSCNGRGVCRVSTFATRGFYCVCDEGFEGLDCEDIFDPCFNDPCAKGSTCSINPINPISPLCHCPPGFHGDRCESRTNCPNSSLGRRIYNVYFQLSCRFLDYCPQPCELEY